MLWNWDSRFNGIRNHDLCDTGAVQKPERHLDKDNRIEVARLRPPIEKA